MLRSSPTALLIGTTMLSEVNIARAFDPASQKIDRF
jgi:hypothetical protein